MAPQTNPLETTPFGIARSMTDIRPANYYLKIDSFSFFLKMLENQNAKSYDSKVFEASGYKWKLSLYPNGDEESNSGGHISLYLSIEETSGMPLGWEVNAHLEFSVFDQIRDRYLTVQTDARRFNEMMKRWGIPKLLPIGDFNDATKGYLICDECVFGVKIWVCDCNYSGKGECVGRPEELSYPFFYTWKITNYSSRPNTCQYSPVFTFANREWNIHLYTRGNGGWEGQSVSAYLELKDSTTETVDKMYAEYKLRVKDQNHTRHHEKKVNRWFSTTEGMGWGFHNFLPLKDVHDASKGFLVEDTLIVEVEITQISTAKSFS